ncbi:unnamed protein product [Alternaria alternata]
MPDDNSKPFLERHHQMADMCSPGEPSDPTPLSIVQLEYAKQVEFLLSSDTVPGLTPEELTIFKSTNCPYAFVCRFPGCSGMLAGFPTQDLRAQHEMTHKPTIFCKHSGCTYRLPFASQQSLGRHIRTFHNAVPRGAPKSIRRRRATHSKDRDDHARKPNAPRGLDVYLQSQSMAAGSDLFELKNTASEWGVVIAYQSQSGANRRGAQKPELHRQGSRMSNQFVGSDIYSPTMSSENYSAFPENLDMSHMHQPATSGSATASTPDGRELDRQKFDRQEPFTLFESVERGPLSSLQTATASEPDPDRDEEVESPDLGLTNPALPKLPAGWIAQWDNSSQKYYYVQIATGVSQWELPSSYEHYRRANGQMKEYPFDKRVQQSPNPANRTGPQSMTVEKGQTRTAEEVRKVMRSFSGFPTEQFGGATGNGKAAENSLMVNQSITNSRPTYLKVPGLAPPLGDLGSPPSHGDHDSDGMNSDHPSEWKELLDWDNLGAFDNLDPWPTFAEGDDLNDPHVFGYSAATEPPSPLAMSKPPGMARLSERIPHHSGDAPIRFPSISALPMDAPSGPAPGGDVFLRASGGSFFR